MQDPDLIADLREELELSRRAQEELRASEERLHAALAALPVTSLDPFGIYSAIRDASGRIVDFRI